MSDDTAALQATLDLGGIVTLENGRVYTVSGAPGALAALFIGSDTTLDLNGATLTLADNQDCSLIGRLTGSTISNIVIKNGTISGNGRLQSATYVGFTPTIYLDQCDHLELRDLEINDAYLYAAHVRGDDGMVDNVRVRDAIGGGLHLTGDRWDIGGVDVRDVTFFDSVNAKGIDITAA
jgi:uncharacterized protein YjbI with pentapeptide repeats